MHERVKGMSVIQMGEKEKKEEKPFRERERDILYRKDTVLRRKYLVRTKEPLEDKTLTPSFFPLLKTLCLSFLVMVTRATYSI